MLWINLICLKSFAISLGTSMGPFCLLIWCLFCVSGSIVVMVFCGDTPLKAVCAPKNQKVEKYKLRL